MPKYECRVCAAEGNDWVSCNWCQARVCGVCALPANKGVSYCMAVCAEQDDAFFTTPVALITPETLIDRSVPARLLLTPKECRMKRSMDILLTPKMVETEQTLEVVVKCRCEPRRTVHKKPLNCTWCGAQICRKCCYEGGWMQVYCNDLCYRHDDEFIMTDEMRIARATTQ